MQVKLADGSIMVCGTLPRDAEYKTVGEKNSSLTTFGVKVGEKPSPDVNERGEAIWCNCVCWHNVAHVAKNLKKSDVVLCIGKIKEEPYEGKIYKKLICEAVFPMVQAVQTAQSVPQASPEIGNLNEFEEILNESDMPF